MANPVAYQENQHNTISAIVDHILFKKTLPEQFFQWLLEMGLWHLRELRLDTFQDVKTELLEVSDRKTVILPPSFVDWVVVAAKVGQYFVEMGVNDKLNLLTRDSNSTDYVAGLVSQNLPNGLNASSYSGYLFNYNGGSVPLAGSFPTKGSFRVHDAGQYKELILDYDYPFTQVYLEYITDGFDPCGTTVVDPYFADFIKKAIEFTWEEEKEPNRTESSIRRRGIAMADAARMVRGRKNDLDPQTLLNISRSQVRFTAHI